MRICGIWTITCTGLHERNSTLGRYGQENGAFFTPAPSGGTWHLTGRVRPLAFLKHRSSKLQKLNSCKYGQDKCVPSSTNHAPHQKAEPLTQVWQSDNIGSQLPSAMAEVPFQERQDKKTKGYSPCTVPCLESRDVALGWVGLCPSTNSGLRDFAKREGQSIGA